MRYVSFAFLSLVLAGFLAGSVACSIEMGGSPQPVEIEKVTPSEAAPAPVVAPSEESAPAADVAPVPAPAEAPTPPSEPPQET